MEAMQNPIKNWGKYEGCCHDTHETRENGVAACEDFA
jgi:hypothetical protein